MTFFTFPLFHRTLAFFYLAPLAQITASPTFCSTTPSAQSNLNSWPWLPHPAPISPTRLMFALVAISASSISTSCTILSSFAAYKTLNLCCSIPTTILQLTYLTFDSADITASPLAHCVALKNKAEAKDVTSVNVCLRRAFCETHLKGIKNLLLFLMTNYTQ